MKKGRPWKERIGTILFRREAHYRLSAFVLTVESGNDAKPRLTIVGGHRKSNPAFCDPPSGRMLQ